MSACGKLIYKRIPIDPSKTFHQGKNVCSSGLVCVICFVECMKVEDVRCGFCIVSIVVVSHQRMITTISTAGLVGSLFRDHFLTNPQRTEVQRNKTLSMLALSLRFIYRTASKMTPALIIRKRSAPLT